MTANVIPERGFSGDKAEIVGKILCLFLHLKFFLHQQKRLKWYCDENHIFPIEPILKHKQVACMTRKMLFTIFKYLFSFQRYLSF